LNPNPLFLFWVGKIVGQWGFELGDPLSQSKAEIFLEQPIKGEQNL
jgi:hypothetical protein